MRIPALLGALAVAAGTFLAPTPAAQAAQTCPSTVAKLTELDADIADGLDLTSCGAPKTVVAEDVAVAIPAPGNGMRGIAVASDGTETTLTVSTDAEGVVSVTTEDHAATTSAQAAAAITRCTDNATRVQGVKWYTSPQFRVNSTEHRRFTEAIWERTVQQSWAVIKTGQDSCGLTRALAVPGRVTMNTLGDANMSASNTCTKPDSYSVIDFGGLSGATVGLTCVAFRARSGHDQIVSSDVRMDSSSRSWVTTATGCSGAKYDLRSVLTHELGHAVGLAHAAERGGDDLTMSPQVTACNTSARALGSGDLRSLYALYPG
ncbi:matrixin family metalloprotease [Microbacterium rhizophilus]|uniref:matrixin family metalloprotease n=1 Tax=Microbacterium rhizophilus TaxID=3138934 RepID=UPI0031F06CA7